MQKNSAKSYYYRQSDSNHCEAWCVAVTCTLHNYGFTVSITYGTTHSSPTASMYGIPQMYFQQAMDIWVRYSGTTFVCCFDMMCNLFQFQYSIHEWPDHAISLPDRQTESRYLSSCVPTRTPRYLPTGSSRSSGRLRMTSSRHLLQKECQQSSIRGSSKRPRHTAHDSRSSTWWRTCSRRRAASSPE